MARTRRRQAQAPAQRLILDSGAVIAWSHGDVHARALLTAIRNAGDAVPSKRSSAKATA